MGHEGNTRDNLRREFALHKAGGGRGRLLSRCLDTLLAVPPTSVQPERDFSVVRLLLGEQDEISDAGQYIHPPEAFQHRVM